MSRRAHVEVTFEALSEVLLAMLREANALPDELAEATVFSIEFDHLVRLVRVGLVAEGQPGDRFWVAEGEMVPRLEVLTSASLDVGATRRLLEDLCREAGTTFAELERLRAMEQRARVEMAHQERCLTLSGDRSHRATEKLRLVRHILGEVAP